MQNESPRRVDLPEPGHFKMRLVKGGWAVPARIECVDGSWRAWIDGEPKAWANDPLTDPDLARAWHYGTMIEAWHYEDLLRLKERMRVEQPEHPCLHPERAMHALTNPVPRRADLVGGFRALIGSRR